jgi:hypothetical protein
MILIHNTFVKITVVLAFITLMLMPSVSVYSSSTDELIIPKSKEPVRIDGKWSSKMEWNDASETKIVRNGVTAYLKMKQDDRFVYILTDFISDEGLDKRGDWAVVCFDTKNDDSMMPLQDDYCFYLATRAGDVRSGIMQGNGKSWTIMLEAKIIDRFADMDSSRFNDPYESEREHVISEFRISKESYGLEEKMGFYVYLNDGYHNNFVEWPMDAGGKQFGINARTVKDVLVSPDKWGRISLD